MTVAQQLEVIARRHAAELRSVLIGLDRLDAWIGGASGVPTPMPAPLPTRPRDVRKLANLEREPLMARVLEIVESDTDELGLIRSRLDIIASRLSPFDLTSNHDSE